MIKHNPLPDDGDENPVGIGAIVKATIAAIVLMFAAGGMIGFAVSVAENGIRHPERAVLAIAVFLALAIGAALVLRRQALQMLGGPVAPNVLKARWLVAAMFVIALPTVFFIQGGITTDGVPIDIADARPAPETAIALIALWLVAVPLLSALWWRQIDELERSAYRDGAFWAANIYAVVTPCWWLAWRAGLTGEPWHMAIFLATMTVWTIAWLIRRYG